MSKTLEVPLTDNEIIGALSSMVVLTLLSEKANGLSMEEMRRLISLIGQALLEELSKRHPGVGIDNIHTTISGALPGQKEKWILSLLALLAPDVEEAPAAKPALNDDLN